MLFTPPKNRLQRFPSKPNRCPLPGLKITPLEGLELLQPALGHAPVGGKGDVT